MPKYVVEKSAPQISAEVIALLEQTETATVGHWRHWGFVDRGVQPLLRHRRVAGTAVTVQIPGPDSTLLHHALGLLRPGDILVVDRLGDVRHACWGGGVTVAAKAAGAKAGVVDGPCTDLEEVEASDFPMWCRGQAPITTRIYDLGGRLNVPVSMGGVVVMPGDAVLCDESGVLVLPPAEAEAEAREAITRQERGMKTQARVAAGEKLGEISGATAKVLAGLG
ncbi:Demethylmenaquinone methyltransferase family [Roseomonas mucosa]|jgi:4-hydroxy-4-methyl-2-oxoglutarate aldolase|uniref:Putative 4-hydroxy-4-methyl-2-oxoglutarate aldolase n=1 Tax=Roseomonas mucosa TaxID=207340 RepID=A0A1S8D6Y5_9PROT|nr:MULTISPECIES: RraA family protein [Roseomonas]MBS5902474.1 RraA family protein [Acetobacteraceae bacterium]MDT8265210.1 RraA family protein [Roseomonas sp. DSM 102946]ATR22869.1 4-hydroxy-4-methyl-2-oxoglutarate aldolase [Roseomonas sp. FDAARGOS_362]MCG7353344.1 RraA family protein [Roseomonas mucosa]MCG7356957.1 RraA family protein [Roseomonas mucosa]